MKHDLIKVSFFIVVTLESKGGYISLETLKEIIKVNEFYDDVRQR